MNTKLYYGIVAGVAILVIIGVVAYNQMQQSEYEKLSQKFQDWVEVKGTVLLYSTRFPKQPETGVQDIPVPNSDITIKQEMFSSSIPDAMNYIMIATSYPSEIPGDVEENLRSSLNGMLSSSPESKLVSSRLVVPVSGPKAMEYEILQPNGRTLKGRLILDKIALYNISVDYAAGAYDNDAYSYFVNSFRPE